jgi:hypothetical protein
MTHVKLARCLPAAMLALMHGCGGDVGNAGTADAGVHDSSSGLPSGDDASTDDASDDARASATDGAAASCPATDAGGVIAAGRVPLVHRSASDGSTGTDNECETDDDCGPGGYCSPSDLGRCFCPSTALCGDAGTGCYEGTGPTSGRPPGPGWTAIPCECGDSCGHGYFCHTRCDTCLDDSDCAHNGTCNFDTLNRVWSCSECWPIP